MNGLIVYPLILLFILTAFSQAVTASTPYYINNGTATTNPYTGNSVINSTLTALHIEATNTVIGMDLLGGFTALIVAFIAVGVVVGVRVAASGLSDYSVQLIHKATVYYGIWGIFSGLSFVVFSSIAIFGIFLWVGLTLIYSLGFFQTLNSGGGGMT